MDANLAIINPIINPKQTLEGLRIGGTVAAPNYQRASIETTRGRIKNESAKRYSFKKTNDLCFTVKRIR